MRSLAFRFDKALAKQRKKLGERALAVPALAPDTLLAGFVRTCALLKRPFVEAEVRSAAPASERCMTLGCLMLAATRLGFKAREIKTTRSNLAALPAPCLLVGRQAGEGWVVRARKRDHLVLEEPDSGRTSTVDFATVADMAGHALLLRPLRRGGNETQWRDTIVNRLRPVLWEVGLASVIINLLALASPIFLTVYNKVIFGALAHCCP
jgi:ABC-type bacteriocin/lantibiotic exporter with double-glycine peptidase domain